MQSLFFDLLRYELHPYNYDYENDYVYDYVIRENPFGNIKTILEYDKVFYDVYSLKDPDIDKPKSYEPFHNDDTLNLHLITEDSLNQVINIDEHIPINSMDKWLFYHFLLVRFECVKYLHLLVNEVQKCSDRDSKCEVVNSSLVYIYGLVETLHSKPGFIKVRSNNLMPVYSKDFPAPPPSGNDSTTVTGVIITQNLFKDSAFNELMLVLLTKLYYEVILVFKQFVKQDAQNLYKQFSKSGTIGALTLKVIVEKFTIARCVLFIETEEYNVKIIDFLLRELYHHYNAKKRNIQLENTISALENYWFLTFLNFKKLHSFSDFTNGNTNESLLNKAQLKFSKNEITKETLLLDPCFNLINNTKNYTFLASLPRSFITWFYDFHSERSVVVNAQKSLSIAKLKSFSYEGYTKTPEVLKTLRDALLKYHFIPKTPLWTFKKIFSGTLDYKPIVWKSNLTNLRCFVNLLKEKEGFLKDCEQNHWFYASNCFVLSDGGGFTHKDIRSMKQPVTTPNVLKDIVDSL